MAISILNYYEQPDGKNLMIMADDLYERNPGEAPDDNMPMNPTNYAISQNLGVPADGSIFVVRDFDENKKSEDCYKNFHRWRMERLCLN